MNRRQKLAQCLGCFLVLFLILPSAQARESSDRWHDLRSAFERGASHGTAWSVGWGSVYGISLAHSVYVIQDPSDSEARLDAQVAGVKSALALAETFLSPQPHAEALERFNRLADEGDPEALKQAEQLRAEVAAEERRLRSLDARIRPLVVNLLGGLVIAIGDDRPGDGAISFATGMLVNELTLWSQPRSLSRLGAAPGGELSLQMGRGRLDVQYSWYVSPQQAGLQVRF
ncbi:hypothetical protein [Marinobacter salicampi]|uniref:hypothetical protein n=1 Tax=Marinobacter salicampi TaxID=435907 RepID=UPI001408C470|nr:hypothetical protein [Marinobacter salicampi]